MIIKHEWGLREPRMTKIEQNFTVITTFVSQVSLEHSNSTHKLYVSLSKAGEVGGVVIADNLLNSTELRKTEHRRDWIFIPVDFDQLRKVFRWEFFKLQKMSKHKICFCRAKDLPFIANRRGWEEFYCPKITKRREERRGKSCRNLKNGKQKCREKEKRKDRKGRRGKGWMWDTRDCSSLPRRREVKVCRREKRRRCIKRQKSKGLAKYEAKLRCQSRGWGEVRPRQTEYLKSDQRLRSLCNCVASIMSVCLPLARNVEM